VAVWRVGQKAEDYFCEFAVLRDSFLNHRVIVVR
jgi:hypothetical protein